VELEDIIRGKGKAINQSKRQFRWLVFARRVSRISHSFWFSTPKGSRHQPRVRRACSRTLGHKQQKVSPEPIDEGSCDPASPSGPGRKATQPRWGW